MTVLQPRTQGAPVTDLSQLREKGPPAELVLGLVYPVGVDATKIGADIKNQLRKFNYDIRSVRLSDLLRELPLETKLECEPPFSRFVTHMAARSSCGVFST